MASPIAIPNSLKALSPFIKRAEDLDKEVSNPDAAIVAYYCRTYAMEKAIKMGLRDSEVQSFLLSLMDTLESSKKNLQISDEKGSIICENFAQSIFLKADEEDRLECANKLTAKQFYSAGTYFDILELFGELDLDSQEKRKYAKWKATDILNAIKNGQKPTAGGPGQPNRPGPDSYSGAVDPPLMASAMGSAQQNAPPAGLIATQNDPYNIPTAPTAPVGAHIQQPSVNFPDAPFTPARPEQAHQSMNNYPAPHNTDTTASAPLATPPYSQGQGYPHPQAAAPQPAVQIAGPVSASAVAAPVPLVHGPGPGTSVSCKGDAKTKDAIELCSFAITALKVINYITQRVTFTFIFLSLCFLCAISIHCIHYFFPSTSCCRLLQNSLALL
jgi:vacuolar protein sorting-associated protein VTA1